jgi:YbbR domain-containing protein
MRKSIFENLGLKLFSLLFALVLWFFVSGKGKSYTEISYSLPLEFKNIPRNLLITNDFKDKIEIRISGPTTLLNSIRTEKLKYTIDLSDISAGESSFSINTENIDILRGLKITKISPSMINLVLEKIIRKAVPIKLNLVGEPPKGYKVVSKLIDPTSVEIEGAQSEVNLIQSIPTIEVVLTDAKETIKKDLDLIFKDIFFSEIVGKKNIAATIEIVEEVIDKEFKDVNVDIRGLEGKDYTIKPQKMDIVITGTYLNLEEFKKESIIAYVNAENITDTSEPLKPVVELPPFLKVKNVTPESFKVIKIKNKSKRKRR